MSAVQARRRVASRQHRPCNTTSVTLLAITPQRLAPAALRCPNLPRLLHLAIAEVRDHGLVNPKAAPCALHASEARLQPAGDADTGHLHVAVDHNLLNVVAKIGMAVILAAAPLVRPDLGPPASQRWQGAGVRSPS